MSWETLPALVVSSTLMMMMTMTHQISCPSPCQCSSQYYIYCQTSGIIDSQFLSLITKVPASAILLDISSNHLTQFPPDAFGSLPNLEYLNLAANGIIEIQDNVFRGLSKLKELSLNQNEIRLVLGESFSALISLKVLDLSDNLIDSLPIQVFGNLSALEKLQLQKNSILNVYPGTFSGLSNMQVLNINHNRLKSLEGLTFTGMRELTTLSLNDNLLNTFTVDSFSDLINLHTLELDGNNISDVLFMYGNDFYLSLTILSLAYNHITHLPSHVLPHNRNLKQIDLSYNNIHRIGGHSFNGLYLESLSLENNNISSINRSIFKGLKRISNLYLLKNGIRDIETGVFDGFRETLVVLDLSSNKLTEISLGMFRGLSRLLILNLAANNISLLEPGAFRDMKELEELNLSGNHFTVLTCDMISGPVGLRHLILVCNPLHRLAGFLLERVDDRITIESNSTMLDYTPTTALITWPYKGGTQLYWLLSIKCISTAFCRVPKYESTLRPYVTQVTVRGLTPGAEYFICVNPVFLSADASIVQCVLVRTEYVHTIRQVTSSNDKDVHSSSASLSSLVLLLLLIIHRLF